MTRDEIIDAALEAASELNLGAEAMEGCSYREENDGIGYTEAWGVGHDDSHWIEVLDEAGSASGSVEVEGLGELLDTELICALCEASVGDYEPHDAVDLARRYRVDGDEITLYVFAEAS